MSSKYVKGEPREDFLEEERTEEHEWNIFLHARDPPRIEQRMKAANLATWNDDLGEHNLIPESVTMGTVSFYFTGTFKEAYEKAIEKCRELSRTGVMSSSTWEFEEGDIMPVS
jgi:hypothetical protein